MPFNEMAKDYFADFEPNEEKVQKVIRAARGRRKNHHSVPVRYHAQSTLFH